MKNNQDNKKIINLDGRQIMYVLKTSSRAKNLRITVRPGGMIIATRPCYLPEKAVEIFMKKKAVWILQTVHRLETRRNFLSSGSQEDYRKNAAAARALALRKIADFNIFYDVSYNRVAIRNQATRWGSCSRRGNLNFNYRIAMLPERLADYIIVHEMCHLREMNHSARFWNLVAVALPDYMDRRRELKTNFS